MKPVLTAAILLASLPAAAAAGGAGEARFGVMILAASGEEARAVPQDVFASDTPEIVMNVQLLDVPAGADVAAAWIADKTGDDDEDYLIDTTVQHLDAPVNGLSFAYSKPTKGWPAGTYRVELSIDGRVLERVPFTVAP